MFLFIWPCRRHNVFSVVHRRIPGQEDLVMKTCEPVSIGQDFFYLLFEDRNIHQGGVPKQFRKDGRIAVDQDVSHTDDVVPRYMSVLFLEFQRKHVSGFSDDFHVFYDGEIPKFVGGELLLRVSFRE